MCDANMFPTDEEAATVAANFMERYRKSMEHITPMPTIQHTHMVRLEDFVTVDQIPLTSDDLDVAIQIINSVEDDDFYDPIVRERDLRRKNVPTIYTTSADSFQEFSINRALSYLAARPGAPQN